MKKISSFSLTFFLFFVPDLFAAPWDQNLPLQSPEEKAAAFLKIRTLIPTLADGAVRYGFDPVTLFNHQVVLEKITSNDLVYQNLKSSHKDLVEFSVFAEDAPIKAVSEKEIEWKNSQERSDLLVKSLELSDQEVIAEIKNILGSPLLGKTQGIVVGLSNLIPGSLKKDLFALPLDNKITILNQNLPLEVVSNGFVPAKLGWNDTKISKEEIMTRLSSAAALEQRLTLLLIHHYSSLKGITATKDYINNWDLAPNQKKTLEQWFNSNVAKMIPIEQPTTIIPNLVLREVPPVVAAFRGFAGNDCSTLHSFPFVYSPIEYTFFVYDSKGAIKGYAQGTKVLSQGYEAFYLHTIAGPRISRSDALLIMKTFVQEKHNLGFKDILLPSMDKVESLINFMPVREAFKQVTENTKLPIEYRDGNLRENFVSTFKIAKSYDDPASNLFGYKIDETKLGSFIKIERNDSMTLERISTEIDKNSLILVLLQLGKNYERNRAMIEALSPLSGLSVLEINKLIVLMGNPEKLPTNLFIEKIETVLKDKGFGFGNGYFKKNISVLSFGLSQASDFLKNEEFAEKVLLNLLEQREIPAVERILLNNPELFKRTNLTISFLRSFYIDVHEAQWGEPKALEVALEQNPQVILKNSEILIMVSKNAKATATLNKFVTENPNWIPRIPKEAGRNLFAARHQKIMTFNAIVKAALRTRNETEFANVTSLKEIGTKLPYAEEAKQLQNEIFIQTMDHYLTLHPQKTIYGIFSSLGNYASKSDSTVRALRKLLPAALKNSSWELNAYLKMAVYLKSRSSNPEAIDRIIRDFILANRDKEKTITLVEKHFPGLNLIQQKALTCGGIFFSTFQAR